MNKADFHKHFKSPGPVVLPVIHVLDNDQAERNVQLALECGAHGVFLINHDFAREQFLPIIWHIRRRFPTVWLGVNFLAVTGLHAFPMLGELQAEGCPIEAYWADDARIDEHSDVESQQEAQDIEKARAASGWNGLYFGGTAFKKQREVLPEHYFESARIAASHMDVVTTSGVATGHSAELEKIETFRNACGDAPIALASGITPDNADQYAPLTDAFLVATGISDPGQFHNLSQSRLRQLLEVTRRYGAHHG